MTELSQIRKRSLRASSILIVTCWLSSRIYLYMYFWSLFALANPGKNDVITFWYSPINFIRHHYFESLLYLRGEPPLPQVILGLLMKLNDWPFTIPLDSFLLSGITLIIAFMLRSIILQINFSITSATILSIAWCIYPGYMAAEISAFPIAFYEVLPAFLFTASLYAMTIALRTGQKKFYWLFGITSGLFPLSRATMTFIFPIPIMIARVFRSPLARSLGFSALALQLLWAGKNYLVYQQFHLETASDVGGNIVWTMHFSGQEKKMIAYAKSKYPDVPFYSSGILCLIPNLNQQCLENFFPDAAKKDRVLTKMGVISGDISKAYGMGDSYMMRDFSLAIKPFFVDFAIHNPSVITKILIKSYRLFWAEMFFHLPHVEDLKKNTLLASISHLFEYYKFFCIAIIHGISIPLAIWILWRRLTGWPINVASSILLYALSLFVYVALVSSLGSTGENTRYRVDVEPLIWLLPFMTFRCLQQMFQRPLQNQDTSA